MTLTLISPKKVLPLMFWPDPRSIHTRNTSSLGSLTEMAPSVEEVQPVYDFGIGSKVTLLPLTWFLLLQMKLS